MIPYERYFKAGQKLVLRRVIPAGEEAPCLDSFAVTLLACGESSFVVRLQKSALADDFLAGSEFEVLGNIYDLGLSLTAALLEVLPEGELRLRPRGNLELLFRRQYLRVDCSLWLGYLRGDAALPVLRRQWKKWVAELAAAKLCDLPPFACHQITLGAGGIGLRVPGPVLVGEMFLVFLALDDGKPLICALAELAWADRADADGLQLIGLQFRSLLDSDRKRIEIYVRGTLRAKEE